MLELNKTLDKLEGELKLSDCEKEYVVKWLSGSSQASFYIGDLDSDHENVRTFINGCKYCYIDIPSFLAYLKTIEHIVKKYKSMYYGPFDHIPGIYTRFSNMKQEDAKVVLNYEYPDRYIRILNNKKGYKDNVLLYGETALKNGDDFRHSYIGGITKIIIHKKEDKYTLYISLIENWRDVLMKENGAKVTLESLVSIFNDDMNLNIADGKSETLSGQIFGVKYGPLLKANEHKFTYEDIVEKSSFNSNEVKIAVKNGIDLSPSIIWSPDLSSNNDSETEGDAENYANFKSLVGWFVNQLNINNGLKEGVKTSGQGYKEGSAIRENYKLWRDYGEFTLDCNIVSGYQSTISKVNYINKTETGINIRPKFNKETKEIDYLYIDVYDIELDGNTNKEICNILEKEYALVELSLFDNQDPNGLVKELFDDFRKIINHFTQSEDKEDIDYDACERKGYGTNVILYGVPGAGKSWTISNEYCKDEKFMERIVFHPDYTYSDFVGQILPKVDERGAITYEFNPGPFSKVMRKAYCDPMNEYYLVIEEVNRGNAPAIFGDIFQLLDRKENGESCYGIKNADIAKVVYGNADHVVRIPSNLSILCTMNTSDQNVFTLDTAFQRRWSMRLIPNKFSQKENEVKFAQTKILDTNVTWEKFFTEINAIILVKNIRMTSSEDKRLGTHFVSECDLEYKEGDLRQNSKFAEKVLKYLWDDAFKFNRDELFDITKVNSLEKVIEKFVVENEKDARFTAIFKDTIAAAILPKVGE